MALQEALNDKKNQSFERHMNHCRFLQTFQILHNYELLQFKLCVSKGKDGAFDYISVTLPYTSVDYGVLMNQISRSSLVGNYTFNVVEYPLRKDMLDSCGCLMKIKD